MKIDISEEELKRPLMKKKIEEIIALKFEIQKHKEYFEISECELEVIKKMGFVPKEKYGETKYPNEIGKFKGKRVVIK